MSFVLIQDMESTHSLVMVNVMQDVDNSRTANTILITQGLLYVTYHAITVILYDNKLGHFMVFL